MSPEAQKGSITGPTKVLMSSNFLCEQECMPVGCILPAHYHTERGVSLTETPLDRDPPWTETPRTETPPDRDPPRDPRGQRPPWSSNLWCMLGQRHPPRREQND